LILGGAASADLPDQMWSQPVGACFGLIITLDGATYAFVCDLFYQSSLLQRFDMVINLLWRILKDLSQIITGTRFIEPAQYFDMLDSAGTVATGKLADLVLLDANPLQDIGNTRRISAVVANGRLFTAADRAKLLRAPAAVAP